MRFFSVRVPTCARAVRLARYASDAATHVFLGLQSEHLRRSDFGRAGVDGAGELVADPGEPDLVVRNPGRADPAAAECHGRKPGQDHQADAAPEEVLANPA